LTENHFRSLSYKLHGISIHIVNSIGYVMQTFTNILQLIQVKYSTFHRLYKLEFYTVFHVGVSDFSTLIV